GKKTAGILVEAVARTPSESAALVGVGVNLNVDSFPADLERTATSVRIEGNAESPVDLFESRIRSGLFESVGFVNGSRFETVIERWRACDSTAGRRYVVIDKDGTLCGTALGVADDGSLLLRSDLGRLLKTVTATSVESDAQ